MMADLWFLLLLVFCFSAGELDCLELGLGSVADRNFNDPSVSFLLRTSSLSVTKDTIRVGLLSNTCKTITDQTKCT